MSYVPSHADAHAGPLAPYADADGCVPEPGDPEPEGWGGGRISRESSYLPGVWTTDWADWCFAASRATRDVTRVDRR